MAGEILRCQEALNKLADAAALARAGEPFGVIPPGPKKTLMAYDAKVAGPFGSQRVCLKAI
jgi:hypothetical protein